MKPKPKTVTVNALAALSNLTARRIRQLAQEDKLPKITRGQMPLEESLKALFQHYQKVSEEMQHERLQLVTTTRKTKEHELEQSQGRYIERELAERTIRSCAKQYHQLVRSEIERHAPPQRRDKLAQLGVTPETVAAFNAFDVEQSQGIINRIEDFYDVRVNTAKSELEATK